MEIHFKITGIILVLLSLIHIGFPKRFKWKEELAGLSLINRQMMQVHTFFIAIVVALDGFLFLFMAEELCTLSPLAKALLIGNFIFWFARCLFQHLVYSPLLWKGKKFETSVHIFFSLFWVYLCFIIGYTLLMK
jgi:hypothetical protein